MRRNRLSLRTPRKTSIARTMGFNRIQLAQYFDNLENVLQKYKFLPNRIYSVAECGFQTVPNKLPKHVAPTGKKDVAKAVAAEQGQTVTAVCCMNATDVDFLPAEVTEQDFDTDISDEDRVFVHFEGEVTQEYPLDPSPQQQSASDAAATRTEPSSEPVLPTCLLPGPSNVAALPQPLESPNDPKQHVAAPSDIIPFPKIKKNRKRTGRSLKSTLLTSTPNKERLMELEEEKRESSERKRKKSNIKNESNDSCDLFSSADEENDSDSVLPTPRPEDFVLVKVFGKNSYRLFIAKVIKPDNDDYEGVFYKRMLNIFRFCETTEGAFFQKNDIMLKLSKPIPKGAGKNLRQEYGKQLKKSDIRSGDAAPDDVGSQWPYFTKLLFLRDQFTPRQTSSNLTNISEELSNPSTNNSAASDSENSTQSDDVNSATSTSIITQKLTSPSNIDHTPGPSTRMQPSTPSASSSQCFSRSGYIIRTTGYKKRITPQAEIGKQLIDLEKEKLALKMNKPSYDHNDEDIGFFNSLLPHVKKLSPKDKFIFRMKIQQTLFELAFPPQQQSAQQGTSFPASQTNFARNECVPGPSYYHEDQISEWSEDAEGYLTNSKKKPWKIFQDSEDYQKSFACIQDPTDENYESAFKTIEQFVCKMYTTKKNVLYHFTSVDEARVHLFTRNYGMVDKSESFGQNLLNFDACVLPPCRRELQQHLLRTAYITNIWSNAHRVIPNHYDPTKFGWVVEPNNTYNFRWFEGDEVPQFVHEVFLESDKTEDNIKKTSDNDAEDSGRIIASSDEDDENSDDTGFDDDGDYESDAEINSDGYEEEESNSDEESNFNVTFIDE
ncbi:hypothetical protein NQ314_003422 [Rhamnusium bicolor]|uniref:BESS domain-containing protein n=1 Tax=Rhamnusium bicolor TaxID=1586634 RepID=A0AAV8ZN96_9CUCU|nr:hypothetical protein NQ314_003422 [Rhamnusium bicolor]